MADDTNLTMRKIDVAWEMTKSAIAGFLVGNEEVSKRRIKEVFKEMYDHLSETIGDPNPS